MNTVAADAFWGAGYTGLLTAGLFHVGHSLTSAAGIATGVLSAIGGTAGGVANAMSYTKCAAG